MRKEIKNQMYMNGLKITRNLHSEGEEKEGKEERKDEDYEEYGEED